jgi:hypothetical protein
MVYKYLLPILLIIGLFGSALADDTNYRREYAIKAELHMHHAGVYRTGADVQKFQSARIEYLQKATYHAVMANNYLKLLDLRSSEKHSIDTDTKEVLESIAVSAY